MEVKCPICSSSSQKESFDNIKFVEADSKQEIKVPINFYICLSCGEDWQTAEQHKTFCDDRDNVLNNI